MPYTIYQPQVSLPSVSHDSSASRNSKWKSKSKGNQREFPVEGAFLLLTDLLYKNQSSPFPSPSKNKSLLWLFSLVSQVRAVFINELDSKQLLISIGPRLIFPKSFLFGNSIIKLAVSLGGKTDSKQGVFNLRNLALNSISVLLRELGMMRWHSSFSCPRGLFCSIALMKSISHASEASSELVQESKDSRLWVYITFDSIGENFIPPSGVIQIFYSSSLKQISQNFFYSMNFIASTALFRISFISSNDSTPFRRSMKLFKLSLQYQRTNQSQCKFGLI